MPVPGADWRDVLVANDPMAFVVLDPADGRVVESSQTFIELVGAPPAGLAASALAGLDPVGPTRIDVPVRAGSPPTVPATVHQVHHHGEPAVLVLLDLESRRREIEHAVEELAEFPRTNPGPVLRLNPLARVDLANEAAHRLFGRETLAGTAWPDLCGGITPELWDAIVGSATPVVHEADIGDRRMSFAHVWQPVREVVFVYGTDVTQLRRQERELAEQARFPDMNPGPVLRLDLTGTVLLSNVAARELLPEATLGARWGQVCPGVDDSFWARVLGAEHPVPLDATIRGRDYQFTHRLDPGRYVFVYGADVTDQRAAERGVRDSERMATLGTLAAGVAHELNNPAAAARRASSHLAEALERLDEAQRRWTDAVPSAGTLDAVANLEERARSAAGATPADALTRADLEDDVASWLAANTDLDGPTEAARQWVDQGLDLEDLQRFAAEAGAASSAAVQRLCAMAALARLVEQVELSTTRVSEIALALKRYTYLGQAEVLDVDIHQGLEDTLLLLGHKIGTGVRVQRELAPDLPRVWGIGSELNQVWMNLIDNAIDAAGPDGTVTLRTRTVGADTGSPNGVHVEVADDGPGIPEQVRGRVFEPFFTTKAPGSGTGLGLATARSIVVDRHAGSLVVESEPGETRFMVGLPTGRPARVGNEEAP